MPPRLGLYSLANTPEELLSRGYGLVGTEFAEDPAFGNLTYNTSYNPAPYTGAIPFQNVFRISEGVSNNFQNPSFGGVSGYRDTGGIMGIEPVRYSADFDTSYGVANEEDEEQVESLVEEEPSGIAKLFQRIGDIYRNLPTPTNLIRSIGENFGKGPTYSRFSPGGTFRGGIYNIDGVNTPIQLVNDFYNRTTGLNRFDRARNRFNQTRSLKDLFGASRTLAEFNNARKIAAAQKASGYTSNFMDRPKSERNYTGPSGRDNTGGDRGAARASDSFSNRSGMGRTGY